MNCWRNQRLLVDCRHSAHKDQTVAVIEAIDRCVEMFDIGP